MAQEGRFSSSDVVRWEAILLFIALLISAGCSGSALVHVWRPADAVAGRPNTVYATELHADGIELSIYEIAVAQKTEVVYGPLVIFPTPLAGWEELKGPLQVCISLRVSQTPATLDFRDFLIVLEDQNQPLRPLSIELFVEDWSKSPIQQYKTTFEPVSVTSVGEARSVRGVRLTYGIDVQDLKPFSLHPNLTLNGRAVQFPPIHFIRDTGRRLR